MIARIGVCIRCGKCCQPPVVVENPCMERGDKRCRFYVEIDNGKLYGHCLIYGSRSKELTKDRLGTLITKEQLGWFNRNCVNYPLAKDAKTGVYPPPECSFSFEVSDG